MAQKVLITGGAGYIGSSLAGRLTELGYDVTIFDSLRYGQDSIARLDGVLEKGLALNQAWLIDPNPGSPKNFRFVKGDLTQEQGNSVLEDLFESGKFDYVFHFAELVGKECCNIDPSLTEKINFYGTKQVVDLALRHGTKLIWNSSSSVYGFREGAQVLDENAEIDLQHFIDDKDHYVLNKLRAEEYIRQTRALHDDFKVVVFRPATVGGLSPRMRMELLQNHFTFAAVRVKGLTLSNPNHYRAYMDIEDLVDSYVVLLKSGRWQNGVYNIGNHNTTKLEVVYGISKIISPDTFEITRKPGKGDIRSLRISSDEFHKTFGFAPSTSLRTTVAPLAELLRERPSAFVRSQLERIGALDTTQQQMDVLLS